MANDADVIVVGYGPTGMALSALLAQSGHRVLVVERYEGLYNLPRAATFDDETMRLFQKLGIAAEVAEGVRAQGEYDWCNAAGEVLIRHHFAAKGVSGWPEFNMMYQPRLEDRLDALCRSLPGLEVLRGHTASNVRQFADGVELDALPIDGDAQVLRASFVIGCDGGNSVIRDLLGTTIDDLGFHEPWLVCDFRLLRPLDLPAALQYGDPAQPTSIVSIGLEHHRFSFMLDDPDQSASAAADEEAVWHRVARWMQPGDAELIRVATYTFSSKIARTWQDGRIFLAGDAAHQMPPFLGQGMCSGVRDAHNLAWKLDQVLRGSADPGLLDTYQVEREPHVRAITEKAIELGRVQTIRDPEKARARDELLLRRRREGVTPETFHFPPYRAGVLVDDRDDRAAGHLFPQTDVGTAAGVRLFDDVAGPGSVLVVRDADAAPTLLPTDVRVVALAGEARDDVDGLLMVVDVTGAYGAWFADHACDAVLVRPDRYVFGSSTGVEQLAALLDRFDQVLRGSMATSTQGV